MRDRTDSMGMDPRQITSGKGLEEGRAETIFLLSTEGYSELLVG